MKKIIPVLYLVTICFIVQSCKKSDSGSKDPTVCFIVKDEITGEPLVTSFTLYTSDSQNPQIATTANYYVSTDATGSVCIEYASYSPYLTEIRVLKPGYDEYCSGDFTHTIISSNNYNEIILKKRSAFIKFHLINQPPVFSTDNFALSAENIPYTCYYTDLLTVPPGSASDTLIIASVVSGDNFIIWNLKRNYTSISDSSFTINAPLKDTVTVEINY
ncbi:MAG: hypothetical protein ABIT08_11155 [Bacteroidia bacterium]